MRAELFKGKVGATMDGTVTSVIEGGTFVMLGDTGAEGLLRGASLKPGSKISVQISSVNLAEGKIDLVAAKQLQTPSRWKVTHWKKPRR